MAWAGTGEQWTISGGAPRSRLIRAASAEQNGFSFFQFFRKPHRLRETRQPDARGTLKEANGQVGALANNPTFLIHTGDITHAAKAQQFDDAAQLIGEAKLDIHYALGEHDILDPATQKLYLQRFGGGATGGGWYAFDHSGVHFLSLVNVLDLKANGLGYLGPEPLAWLDAELRGRSASTRIVVFAHIQLWMIASEWGRAQRPHPSTDAEGRRIGHVPFRALDRTPAAGPWHDARAWTADHAKRLWEFIASRDKPFKCSLRPL